MNELIRLDKFLASQLNISRSDAKKMLKKNSVSVNGNTVKNGDFSFDPYECDVFVAGKKIEYNKYVYIMLNKPKGVVSATTDNEEQTVIDILPESFIRSGLFPAGRLDKNTTGFVLITDDGDFAHRMLSPAHHVKKTYIAETESELSDDDMKIFVNGMKIGDEVFKPAEICFVGSNSENGHCRYEIKIVEGRYHQIKRMFAFVAHPVVELERIRIGNLDLDPSLSPGEARYISQKELCDICSDNK